MPLVPSDIFSNGFTLSAYRDLWDRAWTATTLPQEPVAFNLAIIISFTGLTAQLPPITTTYVPKVHVELQPVDVSEPHHKCAPVRPLPGRSHTANASLCPQPNRPHHACECRKPSLCNPTPAHASGCRLDHKTVGGSELPAFEFSVNVRPPHASHLQYVRPLYCVRDTAADCTVWSLWRMLEPGHTDHSSSHQIGGSQLVHGRALDEYCRTELAASVRGRSTEDVRYLLRAIYVVAVSFRRLRLTELLDAVLTPTNVGRSMEIHQHESMSVDKLMLLCSGLLQVCENGEVDFSRDPMRQFLLRQNIPEIQSGHETMVRICLQHFRRAGEWLILKPWTHFLNTLASFGTHPFFRYALKHWHNHYRLAENTTNDLPAQLHQIIEVAVVRDLPDEEYLSIEKQRLTLDTGAMLCGFYHFNTLGHLYQQMGASPKRAGLFWLSSPSLCQIERSPPTKPCACESRPSLCAEDHDCVLRQAVLSALQHEMVLSVETVNSTPEATSLESSLSSIADTALFESAECSFLSEVSSIAEDLQDLALDADCASTMLHAADDFETHPIATSGGKYPNSNDYVHHEQQYGNAQWINDWQWINRTEFREQ